MSTNRSPEWQGISRIDYKHTHGWFARIYLKGKRVRSKLFSDGQYAGREDALEKARKWRDEEHAKIAPEDRPQRIRYYKKLPKSNTSGRVGISKTFTRSKVDKEQKLGCFSVTWAPTPGKPKNRSFFFNIYGSEEAAFKAACDFRTEKEREMDGVELSKEERERQVQKSIDDIMTYFDNAPEHRHERLHKIHALILSEFPDVKMWMKSTHPCYQRGERWIMLSNRKRSISVQCCPVPDFAALLPNHFKSMLSETCVHYRDTIELRLDDLRAVVKNVLGAPSYTVQHHEPADAEHAAQKEKAEPKSAKKPEKIKGYARTTKAIRRYIEKFPKARQPLLWTLHSLIVDAFPVVRLTIENNMPAYENNGAWLMLNNQKNAVGIAVSNTDALAEFTTKYPNLKSGDAGLTFKKTADIPIKDFKELALNVLKSATGPEEEVRQPAETLAAPSPQAEEAVSDAKRSRPLNTAKDAIAAKLKRKRERLQKTEKPLKPTVLQAQQLPDDVRLYIEAASETHRERLMRLHYVVVATCPDVEVSMKYKMPSYVCQEQWMSFKGQGQSITLYGSDSDSIAEFAGKHPDIKAGKMTLKIVDEIEIPADDVQMLVRKTLLTDTATPQQHAPSQQLPDDVRRYIEAAPEESRARLMGFHNAMVSICPDAEVSMKYKMPSYVHQEQWMSFKSQAQVITLYGSDSASIAEFASKHPDIKAGKMTLKILANIEIPVDDVQILIGKTLLGAEMTPLRAVAGMMSNTKEPEGSKKANNKHTLTVLTRPDPVEEYLRATPHPRQNRLRSLHIMIVEEFPHLKQSTKFRRLTYEGQKMWMSIGNLENSISVHVKDGIGIEEFIIQNPDVESGATWLHLADGDKIPRKSFQILVQRVFGPTEMKAAAEAKARMAAEAKAQEAEAKAQKIVTETPAPKQEKLDTSHAKQPVDDAPKVVPTPVEAETQPVVETPAPKKDNRNRPGKAKEQPAKVVQEDAPMPVEAEAQPVAEAPAPKKNKRGRSEKVKKTAAPKPSSASKPAVTPKAHAPKIERDEEKGSPSLEAIMAYITKCQDTRKQHLLVLHSLIVGECPQVEMSMRMGMPTYNFQGRWVAIANQRTHVSLYVGESSSLFEFVDAHPNIQSGKTCLNFVDGDEVPVLDTLVVIRKNLHPKTIKLDVA